MRHPFCKRRLALVKKGQLWCHPRKNGSEAEDLISGSTNNFWVLKVVRVHTHNMLPGSRETDRVKTGVKKARGRGWPWPLTPTIVPPTDDFPQAMGKGKVGEGLRLDPTTQL